MTETQFKHKVENWLKDENAWFIKYWAGAKFTKEGIPDILACIDGKFYGIELKTTDGRPTALQLINLKKIREAGGVGVLLYPNDFIHFQAYVEQPSELNAHWYKGNIMLQRSWLQKIT